MSYRFSERQAIAELDPYQPPAQLMSHRNPRVLKHSIWGILVLAATAVVGDLPPRQPLLIAIRQSLSLSACILLFFAPAIYWEAFCRSSTRPELLIVSSAVSVGRCLMIYLFANVIFHNLVNETGRLLRLHTGLNVIWWPYPEEAVGLGITVGSAAHVVYDQWVSRGSFRKNDAATEI